MPVASHDNPIALVRRLAVAVSWVGLGLLVACNGDDSTDAASTTTPADSTATSSSRPATSSTTTSTTPPTATSSSTSGTGGANAAEQEVIDRYVAYWDARTAANTGVPNPADPALAEFATGEQLQAVVAETQANLDGGFAFRAADQPANFRDVRVVSIEGDAAVVQECVVDDGLVVRRDTGEIINDSVTTQSVRGEMRRVDGEWRLAAATVIQFWEGVTGCAVDG